METPSSEDRQVHRGRPSRVYRAVGAESGAGPDPEARMISNDRGIWLAVAVGVLLRLVRYLTDRPLWGDEAMVAVNVLGRGFGELLGPLTFFQVAPPGFLWIERAMVVGLGASAWSLRLAPLLCGVVAVPLFGWFARRAVGGTAALLAVAVFAVSSAPIRHAAEVKPYAFDLLAALLLLGPALAWARRPERARPIWMLVAIVPVVLSCSLPSVFVAGGIGLASMPGIVAIVRDRRGRGPLRAWIAYLVMVPIVFAGLFAASTGEQSEAVGTAYRQGYWSHEFPPITDPIRLIGWVVTTHAGSGFGYPIGGERGGSTLSLILGLVGLVTLIRSGDRRLAALLIAPLSLTLLASAIGKYPYGGSARTMQHAAPSICLLIGIGAATLIDRIVDQRRRARTFRGALVVLGIIGASLFTIDLARPYRTAEDQRSRDFARWFWPEMARNAEVGCARSMRGTMFEGYYWRLGRLELYLVNRALALPAGRDPAHPRLDRISEDRPLRCVVYNDDPDTDPALADWLEEMGRRYRLRGERLYTVNGGIHDQGMPREERFRVFEFVP